MKHSCSPSSPFPPPHLGLGGRVSAPAFKQPRAHVLRHVSATQESSLARGEERRLQISQGEEGKEPKRPCEACAHQPPYSKSGAPRAARALGRRPLVAEREHYERFSDRIDTLPRSKQEWLAWSTEKRERRGQGQAKRGG